MFPSLRSRCDLLSIALNALPIALLAVLILLAPAALHAASPSSGTVSDTATLASWTGGPKLPTASADCGGTSGTACDYYRLTVVPPTGSGFAVRITLTAGLLDDYDLQVYGPGGGVVGDSGSSPGQPETVVLTNPAGGVYTVAASPYAVVGSYSATATLTLTDDPAPPSTEEAPRYATHVPPDGVGRGAGEPTLGVNEETGNVMYIAGLETLRVGFDGCTSPARASWTDVSFLTTSITSFDPILYTDQGTGRTFVSQLLPAKVSLMAFTDDDGATWTPSQGAGINSGVDHQSVGGGPFADGLLGPVLGYPNAVYYCSQDIGLAQCATSIDGGLTFGPAVPIYNLTECGGLHGHPKVAPDGTVYMPNKGCNGEQAAVVSEDSGLTWQVRHVPGSSAGEWDPSVAVATDGTVYFGFGNGDGHPYVAVSRDRGATWTDVQDVGTAFGIENVSFPAIVAGDPDRAAFAFLGTPATGDVYGEDPTVPAEWHLYVAHTYDGGRSWVTSDVTPDDPVQRGPICSGGTLCGSTRNLLDFMDATIDAEGRVLVGYADGCLGGCVSGPPNSATEVATIARQMTGQRMYAAFDPVDGPPGAPAVDAVLETSGVRLAWPTPAENGSAITAYHVYSRTAGTQATLLATLAAGTNEYLDGAGDAHTFYSVTAENAFGEGATCEEVTAEAPAFQPLDSCAAPGIRVAEDPAGDGVPAALDARVLSVAEPVAMDGSSPIVFTLEVGDLSNLTSGAAWVVLWNRPQPDATYDRNYVAMRTTAPNQASFEYGKVSPPNLNLATKMGDAGGSYDPATGTITISVLPEQVDGVGAGQDLAGLEARTFLLNVSGMPVSQLAASDFTPAANYTLQGNAHCLVNNAPVAVADSALTQPNKPVKVPVLGNDSDPDGDPLEIVELGTPSHGRLIATKKTGIATYKPNAGFTGTDSFTYTVSDGAGGTATAVVTVTVE
jgi:hypothetical protein